MVDFRRSRTRDVGVVLVLALLVVDGVLVVMALRNQPEPPTVTVMDDPPPATPTESPTPAQTTISPTPEPTTTTPTPSETTEPVESETPRELPLSVLDDRTAVRGIPGTCASGDGSLEITDDGGVTWTPLEIPELAVVRVRIVRDDLFFIGADTECRTDLVRDKERDETWVRSGSTNNAWHLLGDPAESEVHAPPNSVVPGPCEEGARIVELEGRDDVAAYLLCSDGSVHLTGDAGADWELVGTAPGASAMGLVDGSLLVAATGVEGCDGLAIQDLTPEGPTEVGCVEGATDNGVALSFAGQVGFLLAGGDTWTTADGGATWTPAA